MSFLSAAINRIQPSPTIAVTNKAAQLKRDTLEHLTTYRQKGGLNSLALLAAGRRGERTR